MSVLLRRTRPGILRATLLALAAIGFFAKVANSTEIIHFDLRQEGASTLVVQQSPDRSKKYVLIDTGMQSNDQEKGAAKVRSYLEKHRISRLDVLVLAHLAT